MDVAAVLSYAEGFSRALIAADPELIVSYLCDAVAVDVSELENLPALEMAKVLFVTPLGNHSDWRLAEEFVSVTNFWSKREELLLRAVWVQDPHQLRIRKLEVVERQFKESSERYIVKGQRADTCPHVHQRFRPQPLRERRIRS